MEAIFIGAANEAGNGCSTSIDNDPGPQIHRAQGAEAGARQVAHCFGIGQLQRSCNTGQFFGLDAAQAVVAPQYQGNDAVTLGLDKQGLHGLLYGNAGAGDQVLNGFYARGRETLLLF